MQKDDMPASVPRIFPPISPELYTGQKEPSSLTQERRLGNALIALSWRQFSVLERWCGWRLNAAGKVGRLLLFHRLAMEAELDAQIRRADFFWRAAHAQLRTLSTQSEVWTAVLKSLPEAQDSSLEEEPERLFTTLAREVFLETHQAYFQGLALSLDVPPADHRSYAHLDYVRQMIDLVSHSAAARREALVLPTIKQVSAYQEVKQWKRAEQLSVDLLRRFPDLTSCQALHANLIFVKTLTNLNNDEAESEAKCLRDARTLQSGIDSLKQLRRDYPHNSVMLELIGQLYYLRSIKLANARHLAEALADVQAALTYAPNLEEAVKTRENLNTMMQDLRVQLSEAASKVSQEPKTSLSLKGLRMKREVAQGFRLMDAFKHSEEARLLAEDVRAAQARKVWEEIGLEPLAQLDLRPLGLYATLQTICQNPPQQAAELPLVWRQAASVDPELSNLDSAAVCSYLTRLLYQERNGGTRPASAALAPTLTDAEPSLIPASGPTRPLQSEPFGYWLFSRQGLLLKLQCAAAILLFLMAGVLGTSEYTHRQNRAVAYREIHAAKETQDFQRMVEQAENFLLNPTLGTDSREAEVKALYSEALVRWVTSKTTTTAQVDLHARRYRALVLGLSEGQQP